MGILLLVFFSSLVAQKSLGLDFEAMAAGTPRGDVPQWGIMEDWGASNGGWRKARPTLPVPLCGERRAGRAEDGPKGHHG